MNLGLINRKLISPRRCVFPVSCIIYTMVGFLVISFSGSSCSFCYTRESKCPNLGVYLYDKCDLNVNHLALEAVYKVTVFKTF